MFQNKPNRLINEKSPYLLQHAYNPVDWHPWDEQALEMAKREDKPILLSIGYSTCHWCHVMEKESFTDPKTAEIMNQYFVCIKVDREERPDLDKIYITAVTAMTGSAGWPLNVFLTPHLRPFFGGTYFPPDPRFGIVAWPDLLKLIASTWNTPGRRKKLLASADEVTKTLDKHLAQTSKPAPFDPDLLHGACNAFESSFDEKTGGFSNAPKFPCPVIQNFLMSYHAYAQLIQDQPQQGDKALDMAFFTLRAMAKGGIYDHLGGGFHRYSTDAKWHVPHFEKMLYDNAQLIINYVEAFQVGHDPFFAQVAEETAEYVLRDMTHLDGGFYSGEDADSVPAGLDPQAEKGHEKVEGAFYVWKFEETERILGNRISKIFAYRYGMESGGNAEYDPHGEFKGENILFAAHSLDETADQFNLPAKEAEQILREAKTRLFNARLSRPRPHLDDKILTSWNGLMISAMSKAYQILGDEKYLTGARNAAKFIQKHLYDHENKALFRRWREGERKISGMANDYAFLTQGLIDLYESDVDPKWLEWALELADEQIGRFYDSEHGGFFMTGKHDRNLILRVKDDHDSVLPSASSTAVMNLLRLARLGDRQDFFKIAEKTLSSFVSKMSQEPGSVPQMLAALCFALAKPGQVTQAPSQC